MPKVSIIVPVYKVESYIAQCINSLIKQTLKDIEIILVEDGSPDRCGKIVDEYASKDNRIKVIHQANAGLGMARNAGMAMASGDYLGFVDSDDWVEPDMFECLYKNASNYDADIVKSRVITHNSLIHCKNKNKNHCKNQSKTVKIEIFKENQVKMDILYPLIGPSSPTNIMKLADGSVCINIYKRSMIEENNVCFKSEREYYGEDFLFNLVAFHKAKTVVSLNQRYYHYRLNHESLTTCYRPSMQDSVLRLNSYILKYINENGLGEEGINRNKIRFANFTFNMIYNVCKLSNSSPMTNKIMKIKEIMNLPQVLNSFIGFNIKTVPVKWKWIFFNIKYKNAFTLYLICTLKQILVMFRRNLFKILISI